MAEKFGDDFEANSKGLRDLADRFGAIGRRTGPKGYGVLLNRGDDKAIKGKVPRAYVGQDKYAIYFNKHFIDDTNWTARQSTVIHESAHLTGAYLGFEYYKRAGIEFGIREGFPMSANADSYACFAFSVYCGFDK